VAYYETNTAYDVMKEFLIRGAELTEPFGFPILQPINVRPTESIDFGESGNRKIKNFQKLNCNFYIDDIKFQCVQNQPDKYLDRLSWFGSVCSPDFSISTSMPLVMQLWNKYRNMALAFYWRRNGIKVIPSVSIIPGREYEWLLDGLPKHSTLACCTNGRVRSKASRLEFCEGFYQMCDKLQPNRVVLFGRVPDELQSPVEIINLKTRNQKINERMSK